MSHAAAMSELSSAKDVKGYIEKHFPPHILPRLRLTSHKNGGVLDYDLRLGQDALLRLASDPSRKRAVGKLITGYGKSLAIIGAFVARIAVGDVRRLLIVVPTDEQRTDFLESSGSIFKKLAGFKTEVWDASDTARAIRMLKTGDCRIFVVSIQSLSADMSLLTSFLSASDQWMVAFDEIQYYPEKLVKNKTTGNLELSAWSKQADRVCTHANVNFVVGLSATPTRSDGRLTYFGEWDFEIPPKVALEEKAVRYVKADEEDYLLDVTLKGEAEPRRLKCSEVEGYARKQGLSLSDWELRNEVRYNTKYTSMLLHKALTVVDDLRLKDPRACMIVFAMSVAHAQSLAKQFNQIAGSRVADYVGDSATLDDNKKPVGRSREENQAIISEFKSSKTDNANIYVLIQVTMAAVGFNHPPACVGLFLNNVGESVLLLQQIGRLLRWTKLLDTAHLLFSSDHLGAALMRRMEDDFADPNTPDPSKVGSSGGKGGGELPFPSWMVVGVQPGARIVTFPWGNVNMDDEGEMREAAKSLIASQPEKYGSMDHGALLADLGAALGAAHESQTTQQRLSTAENLVKTGLKRVASRMVRMRYGTGNPPSSYAGDVIVACNAQWKRETGRGHAQMLEKDFEAKHEWLRQVYHGVGSGVIPRWMP